MANTSLTQPAETSLPRQRLKALLEGEALGQPALIYLILITVAEAITNLSVPQTGLALHGVILCLLLAHASLASKRVARRFLLALALAPLIRLLSLSMPLVNFPFVYWYMVVGAPLFLAALVAARIGGIHRGMLGLNARRLPVQMLVGLSGLGLGYLEYRILHPDPLASALSLDLIWLPALILLVFTGFLEELIFRGLMQYTALRGLGLRGLYYVAAAFAVLHIGYRSVLDMIFVFVVAVYFSWVVQRSGSLLGVTLAHGLTNISLFLIFPFLVGQPKVQAPVPQEIMAPPARAWTTTPRATFTPAPTRTPTALPSPTPTSSPTMRPSATPAPSATIQACQPPQGWVRYSLRAGDTAANLSASYGIPLHSLLQANCLKKDDPFQAGMTIFVPPSLPPAIQYPSPTRQPAPTATQAPPRPTQANPVTATHVPPTQAPTSTPPMPTNPPLATRIPATPIQPIPTAVPPTPSPPPPPTAEPPTPSLPPLPPPPTSPPLPTATMAPKPTVVPTIPFATPMLVDPRTSSSPWG